MPSWFLSAQLGCLPGGGSLADQEEIPGCNRPYYNEPVRGPLYNYPFRPSGRDVEAILTQLGLA